VGDDGYAVEGSRYGGRGVTLYGKGEAVAVSYSSSNGSRSTYLGKDTLGSVRTATTDTGAVEDRYEYDAFGMPYSGDLSGGMNLGYTGKPYDTATGLYNYGYRDYSPQAARFTTVDPIRDGNNWFAYVNNDPVNYVDLWGLRTMDNNGSVTITTHAYIVNNTGHTEQNVQNQFNNATTMFNSQGVPITYSLTTNFIEPYTTTGFPLNSITVPLNTDINSANVDIGKGIISGTGQLVDLIDTSGSSFIFIFTETIINTMNTAVTTDGYNFDNTTTSIIASSAAGNVTGHEFGHAVGLPHVPDINNLMYKECNGSNTSLSPDQIMVINNYLSTR
jgi:RHS repeat-associated protein